VELGNCQIEPLPHDLPVDTEIEVTIKYDEEARVHVYARVLATGQEAQTEIIRPENIVVSSVNENPDSDEVQIKSAPSIRAVPLIEAKSTESIAPLFSRPVQPNLRAKPAISSETQPKAKPLTSKRLQIEESDLPIPLCNNCGEPVDARGKCSRCDSASKTPAKRKIKPPPLSKLGGPESPIKNKTPDSLADNSVDDSEFWRNFGQ